MLSDLRTISSSRKDLVNFGQVMAVACAVVGGLSAWRHHDVWVVWLGASAFFLVARFVYPPALLPLQKVWMAFAVVMGWVMNRVILGILFFVVFTTIGGVGRLLGKRFLELHIDKRTSTYWIKRAAEKFDPKRCEQQF